MDHAFFMRSLQRVRNLDGQFERLLNRYRSPRDLVGECFSFDQFKYEKISFVESLEPVNRTNVWMVQRRDQFCFALESRLAVAVVTELFGQKFDRDTAPPLRVGGLKYFAHSAFSEQRCDF